MLIIDSVSRGVFYFCDEMDRFRPFSAEPLKQINYFYTVSKEQVASLYAELQRTRFWERKLPGENASPDVCVGNDRILAVEIAEVTHIRVYNESLPPALAALRKQLHDIIGNRFHPEGAGGLDDNRRVPLSPEELPDLVHIQKPAELVPGNYWPLIFSVRDVKKATQFRNLPWESHSQYWVAGSRYLPEKAYFANPTHVTDPQTHGLIDAEINYCFFPLAFLAKNAFDRYSYLRSTFGLPPLDRQEALETQPNLRVWLDESSIPLHSSWLWLGEETPPDPGRRPKSLIINKGRAIVVIQGQDLGILKRIALAVLGRLAQYSME